MKYQKLGIVVVILVIAFIAIDSSLSLRGYILDVGSHIKIKIQDSKETIASAYQKHFNQARLIEQYEQKLQQYDKLELEILKLRKELDSLSLFDTQQTYYYDSRFLPARAYSYIRMGDYNRVWIEFDVSGYENGKIFGIVQDGKALGIAIVQDNRLIGLLNGEKKSSYSVFIGDEKIPALIHYNSIGSENIIADYIPLHTGIDIGNKVFTSGLDGIFIEGILVGEVVSIRRDYGYITAEIHPYAKNFNLGYIWLVDTKMPLQASTF